MVLGLLQARLLVRESRSLKDKRQVVRSILDRLKGQFNVSAAEVDTLDDHRQATIAVAAVGPEMELVRGVLQTIQNALRGHPVAEYLGGELSLGSEVV
jgi:uncharacterized protein YlxP (DUF503 family)